MPESKSAAALTCFVKNIAGRVKRKGTVLCCVDSSTLAYSLQPWIRKLVKQNIVSHILYTFCAALRDFEISHEIGVLSKKDEIMSGSFGISEDTLDVFLKNAKKNIPLPDVMKEMFLKKAGQNKQESLLYTCFESNIPVIITCIEHHPVCSIEKASSGNREALERIGAECTGDSLSSFLLPGNGKELISYFESIMHRITAGILSPGKVTAGIFSNDDNETFLSILAACGMESASIEGEPGFFFPFFAETLLDTMGIKRE